MVRIILIFLRSEVSRKMNSNKTENNVKIDSIVDEKIKVEPRRPRGL